MLKKILLIILILIANFAMILASFVISHGLTEPLIKVTDIGYGFEPTFVIPILFIGLCLFATVRNFRRFGVGVTALVAAGLPFMMLSLNKLIVFEGEYKTIEVFDANWVDDKYFLEVGFKNWGRVELEVPQEKCLKVDSADIMFVRGLFGMKVITNNIRISESTNCEHVDLDTSNFINSHKEIAETLAKTRCFSPARYHYSQWILLDSLNPKPYYHRGLLYMVSEDYASALKDFASAATLEYAKLDSTDIAYMENMKSPKHINTEEVLEILEGLDIENDELIKNIEYLGLINTFDTYSKRIKYCMEKLKINEQAPNTKTAIL